MNVPDQGFVTVAEAAARFRVSKMTVYRLVHTGEISSIRVGRSIRIPADELAAKLTPPTAGEDTGEIGLRTFTAEQGRVELAVVPPRRLARNLVEASRHMLGDAANYVEFALPARDSDERFVLTVQRVGAGLLTPHEAREAAEAGRDGLRALVERLRGEIEHDHPGRGAGPRRGRCPACVLSHALSEVAPEAAAPEAADTL
ncbi:hypothetical protein GCM10017673_37570 [Streptosporangium violaceochromogenes]|nr:hypothetical protein GCM10017673_37570 [Streptosporangium violaceochromogenes]